MAPTSFRTCGSMQAYVILSLAAEESEIPGEATNLNLNDHEKTVHDIATPRCMRPRLVEFELPCSLIAGSSFMRNARRVCFSLLRFSQT